MTRRAVLASADDLEGAFHFNAVGGEGARQNFGVLNQNIDLAADKIRRSIAKDMLGSAVHPLNRTGYVRRDDGVGRGIYDGVIPRVLPLAQDSFASSRNSDVIDLQQAI